IRSVITRWIGGDVGVLVGARRLAGSAAMVAAFAIFGASWASGATVCSATCTHWSVAEGFGWAAAGAAAGDGVDFTFSGAVFAGAAATAAAGFAVAFWAGAAPAAGAAFVGTAASCVSFADAAIGCAGASGRAAVLLQRP